MRSPGTSRTNPVRGQHGRHERKGDPPGSRAGSNSTKRTRGQNGCRAEPVSATRPPATGSGRFQRSSPVRPVARLHSPAP